MTRRKTWKGKSRRVRTSDLDRDEREIVVRCVEGGKNEDGVGCGKRGVVRGSGLQRSSAALGETVRACIRPGSQGEGSETQHFHGEEGRFLPLTGSTTGDWCRHWQRPRRRLVLTKVRCQW